MVHWDGTSRNGSLGWYNLKCFIGMVKVEMVGMVQAEMIRWGGAS